MDRALDDCIVTLSGAACRRKLYCIPGAGANSGMFRTWRAAFGEAWGVSAIEPPGRGRSRNAEPIADMPTLVDHMVRGLIADAPEAFCLFGHSLGAHLAFELAQEYRRRLRREPLALIVCSSGAPGRTPPARRITQDERTLLRRLRLLGGTPPELLANPGVMKLLLPAIRADFELADNYCTAWRQPLSCPIVALGGADDTLATPEMLLDWAKETVGPFDRHVLPGGHFFAPDEEARLLRRLGGVLAGLGRAAVPAGAAE